MNAAAFIFSSITVASFLARKQKKSDDATNESVWVCRGGDNEWGTAHYESVFSHYIDTVCVAQDIIRKFSEVSGFSLEEKSYCIPHVYQEIIHSIASGTDNKYVFSPCCEDGLYFCRILGKQMFGITKHEASAVVYACKILSEWKSFTHDRGIDEYHPKCETMGKACYRDYFTTCCYCGN